MVQFRRNSTLVYIVFMILLVQFLLLFSTKAMDDVCLTSPPIQRTCYLWNKIHMRLINFLPLTPFCEVKVSFRKAHAYSKKTPLCLFHAFAIGYTRVGTNMLRQASGMQSKKSPMLKLFPDEGIALKVGFIVRGPAYIRHLVIHARLGVITAYAQSLLLSQIFYCSRSRLMNQQKKPDGSRSITPKIINYLRMPANFSIRACQSAVREED